MGQTITDTELKQRHRDLWALGDYASVAHRVIPGLGQVVVDAVAPQPGERVLDVAAGSGNAAIPAARTGADVLATDLCPPLLEAGRRAAEAEGVHLRWEGADAEALPYDDGEFDVAMSCVGIMFAPHHQAAADELVRVVRPGGRLGLISWTPGGFIGRMFATMKPYAPPPPPGVQPPPLWGEDAHVRSLLGDRVTDVRAERRHAPIDCFATAEDFRDFFKHAYGPTIAVYRSLADDADRQAALDRDLADLARGADLGGGRMQWEYLLLTATRS